jgi:PPOX class probable F420-dependent enzyme
MTEISVEPSTTRPYMPGYGIETGADGLLPWSWAVERLIRSHDYWVASLHADGRPHVMPVWAVWLDDALWFSTSVQSRKARNLRADPRCTVTTDDPLEPVVVEGAASVIRDQDVIARYLAASNEKYAVDYSIDFLDPAVNHTIRVDPETAFGLTEAEFTRTPTRWTFHP